MVKLETLEFVSLERDQGMREIETVPRKKSMGRAKSYQEDREY